MTCFLQRNLPMRAFNRLMIVMLSTLSLAACGQGKGGAVTDEEMTMGKADAKVTVIEYASASCGHCATFHAEVFPAFKTKYVDTGRVKYVFREFITPPAELAAAGFLTARCGGKDKYFSVLDGVFRSQEEIFRTGDMRSPLVRVAKSAGLTEEQFMACVSDEKALKALATRVEKFAKQDNITGTPTFLINGEKLDGEQTITAFDKAIAAAEAAAK
jgi:protein-disulfide isomerase